jgi:hypothetical protein
MKINEMKRVFHFGGPGEGLRSPLADFIKRNKSGLSRCIEHFDRDLFTLRNLETQSLTARENQISHRKWRGREWLLSSLS